MNNVLRFVSAGVAALGAPWMPRQYPKFSNTPFSDDRKKLHQDYLRVRKDLQRSIAKVKEENAAEAHRR
jgi:hypothetical protein